MALKLAPLAEREFKAWRRSNRAKNLDRLVIKELAADDELGQGSKESLETQWAYIHGDPRGAVLVAGLLAKGEMVYLEALKIRAQEILEGLETLPLGIEGTVDRLVAAVRNNFAAAQRTTEEAVQRGTSGILSAIDEVASRDQVAQLSAQISGIQNLLARPPQRVLVLPTSVDATQARYLGELKGADADAAARLAEVIDAAGMDGVIELAERPPEWTDNHGAALWEAVAGILADRGPLRAAERACLRRADADDVDDEVDALMAAARCAQADSRPAAADAHLKRARAIDPADPMVVLFEASREEDPEVALATADSVEPNTDRQRGRREAQRATALLLLGRFDDARQAAQASVEASPYGPGEELSHAVTIFEAQALLPERERDDRPLLDAIEYHLSLQDTMLEARRVSVAGVAGARAALATSILGDRRATIEAIERVVSQDGMLAEDEARNDLLTAAVRADDAERARALLAEPDGSARSRIQHATVSVLLREDRPAAAAALDEVIPTLEQGELRRRAIVMRLLAAEDPEVALDTSIADELDDREVLVAHTKAARALAAGDTAAAREAVSRLDDLASLALRTEIAETEGKLPEAVSLQQALTRKQRTAGNMLRLAGLRACAGDFSGAIDEALRLAGDERKVRSARIAAFRLAARAATDAGDFQELEDIADRWASLDPEDSDPRWVEASGLARQGRHEQALAFVRRHDLEPSLEGNRHMILAEIYQHGITDGSERMRALMELSDRFDRPEELERAFIGGVLMTPVTDRGEDDDAVIARFQDAISNFDERFPDSGMLVKISVDEDEAPESIIEKVAAAHPAENEEQVEARQEAIDGVRQGRTPVAFLAGLVGRSTAETIIRNGAHPLAVFDQQTHEAEVSAAVAALDSAAASWDEAACITLAQLPETYASRLLAALAASVAGQSVKDSLTQAAARQMGGEQFATMQILPDGTPQIYEENPDTIARIRQVERDAADWAAKLTAEPDRALGDDRLAQALRDASLVEPAAAVVSALLVARERGIPLYSDDRVVRAFGRGFGLQAFGTVALADAAVRRGLLQPAEGDELLQTVVDLGVWSLAFDPMRYVDAARRSGFDLERCLRPLLADEVLLRTEHRLPHNALLLATLAVEAPNQLEPWARAVIDSYRLIVGVDPMVAASLIVAALFAQDGRGDQTGLDPAQRMSVIEAVRAADDFGPAGSETDPLVGAMRRWLHAAEEDRRNEQLAALLSQVDDETARMLRGLLEEGPPPDSE